jgi:hypothetical protein
MIRLDPISSLTDNRLMWRDMEQFDPDDPNSYGLLVNPDIPVLSPGRVPVIQFESDEEEESTQKDKSIDKPSSTTTAPPKVDDTKYFSISSDLKSIFQKGRPDGKLFLSVFLSCTYSE